MGAWGVPRLDEEVVGLLASAELILQPCLPPTAISNHGLHELLVLLDHLLLLVRLRGRIDPLPLPDRPVIPLSLRDFLVAVLRLQG